eukprot:230168_1
MSSPLSERIEYAKNADDLLQVFKAFSIEELRDIASNAVDSITQDKRNLIELRSCSIHKIISHDVVQKILSFIPYYSAVQCVDKTFKDLSIMNAKIAITETNKLINDANFQTDFEENVARLFIKHTENEDAPKQFLCMLTQRQVSLCHSFEDIHKLIYLNRLKKNACNKIIIFVEEGEYTLSNLAFDGLQISEISIIGINDNVTIRLSANIPFMVMPSREFYFQNNMYLQNITIVGSEQSPPSCISLTHDGLWMKNTTVKQIGIVITGGDFYAKKCRFMTLHNVALKRLNNDGSHNFSVLGCIFNAVNNIMDYRIIDTCIEIETTNFMDGIDISENTGNIRIIGNIFKGEDLKSPITACPHDSDYLHYECTSVDKKDWNERRIKIYFSNHKTIEYNVIIGHGCINANDFKTKQIEMSSSDESD